MSSCWRMATFHDMWPEVEMGVNKIPFTIYLVGECASRMMYAPLSPTLLRFKLSMASLKSVSPVEDMPDTLY